MGDHTVKCDGCGLDSGQARKPWNWFQRTDKDTRLDWFACSRQCIDRIAEEHGTTRVILPW